MVEAINDKTTRFHFAYKPVDQLQQQDSIKGFANNSVQ